ncbi:MAG: 7,8-dihydro-8-oxoguanine-triphosphatase [Candidatus Babeliales bacterium]
MDTNVVKALIFHKIDDTVQLLILKRSNHVKKFPGFEDLPGGKVDTTENILSALAREIQEETQLEVDHINLLSAHIWPEIDNPSIQYKEYLFCTHATGYHVTLNPEEHSSFRWIKLDEINKSSLHPSMKKIILEHKDKIFDYIKDI